MSVFWAANSELSNGVLSINQPTPLASESIRIVPALGIPESSKPVIVADASCPLDRSVIWISMSSFVGDWSKSDQILVALLLRTLII